MQLTLTLTLPPQQQPTQPSAQVEAEWEGENTAPRYFNIVTAQYLHEAMYAGFKIEKDLQPWHLELFSLNPVAFLNPLFRNFHLTEEKAVTTKGNILIISYRPLHHKKE